MDEEHSAQRVIVPVIIAGGRGSRLWPLSKKEMPKPFLSTGNSRETLLQTTLRRVAKVQGLASPLVVCEQRHEHLLREQASEFPGDLSFLLEPEGRGTAPALCAAALHVERTAGGDAVLLALPADHAIAGDGAFADAVADGAGLADAGFLVTFAVKPKEPATGYGYLKLGAPLSLKKQHCRVDSFIEKPDLQTAKQFLLSGEYAWNSGIFMFSVAKLIAAFEQFQPEILKACRKALEDNGALNPAFAAASSISIDYAIMEKASNVAAVVADFSWSDMGDWNSVWLEATKDQNGVATRGDVFAVECAGCLIRSEGPRVLGVGLENMIVVVTKDAILVAPRSRTQDIRRAVDEMAAREKFEAGEQNT